MEVTRTHVRKKFKQRYGRNPVGSSANDAIRLRAIRVDMEHPKRKRK